MSKGIRFKKNADLCKVYNNDVIVNRNVFIGNNNFTNGYFFPSSGSTVKRYLRIMRFTLPEQWNRLNVCLDIFDKEQMRGWYTLYLGLLNTSSVNVNIKVAKYLSIDNSDYLQVQILKINSTTIELQVYTGESNYVMPIIALKYIATENANVKVEILNAEWSNTETQDYSNKFNFTKIA